MSTESNATQDGFLSRWSKRKLGEDQSEEESPPTETSETATEDRSEELEKNRLAAEAVDLDKIDKDFDFSIFLKAGVPKALKNRALHVLWKSDPVFANIDGLVDYGENFADPALTMKTFQSAYEVGKGYLKKLEALAKNEQTEQTEAGDSEKAEIQTETEPNEKSGNDEEMPHVTNKDNESNITIDQNEPEPVILDSEKTHRVSLKRRLELES